MIRTEDDVKISGVTFDRAFEMLRSTWHILLVGFGMIWAIASYKSGLDNHLLIIDDHLRVQEQHLELEDKRLQWLMRHAPNKDGEPEPYDPQRLRKQPQSEMTKPKLFSEDVPPSNLSAQE